MKEQVEKHIGPVEKVFQDTTSDEVKVDILWVKATEQRPYHLLVTSGMSSKAMNVPEGVNSSKYVELCMQLSPDWKFDEESLKTEDYYWPIRWTLIIAKFPHLYGAWLGWGATFPNGEDFEYSESTKLSSMAVLQSSSLPKEFLELKTGDKTIEVLSLFPLYKEEMDFKKNNGIEKLLQKFQERGVKNVINITRPNACV